MPGYLFKRYSFGQNHEKHGLLRNACRQVPGKTCDYRLQQAYGLGQNMKSPNHPLHPFGIQVKEPAVSDANSLVEIRRTTCEQAHVGADEVGAPLTRIMKDLAIGHEDSQEGVSKS